MTKQPEPILFSMQDMARMHATLSSDISNVHADKAKEAKARFDAIVEKMAHDCSDWIKESQLEPVYRGTGAYNHSSIVFDAINLERRPKDSTPEFQEAVDKLRKMTGAKRSNSLFCTGDKAFASGYGRVYVILPTNGYKYVWNVEIKDLLTFNDSSKIRPIRKNVIAMIREYFKKNPEKKAELISKTRNQIFMVAIQESTNPYKSDVPDSMKPLYSWANMNFNTSKGNEAGFEEYVDAIRQRIVNDHDHDKLNDLETTLAKIEKRFKMNMGGDEWKDQLRSNISHLIQIYGSEWVTHIGGYDPRKMEEYIGRHFRTDGLIDAIDSENEIMITGTTYYAIEAGQTWDKYVLPLLTKFYHGKHL